MPEIALMTIVAAAFIIVAPFLVQAPKFRMYAFFAGGLFVLDTPGGITPGKILYMAFCGTTLILTLRDGLRPRSHFATPAILLVCLLLIQAIYSPLLNSTTISAYLRDSFTIALPLVGIPIALDALRRLSPREIDNALLLVGSLAAVQFLIVWSSRRGDLGSFTEVYGLGSRSLAWVVFAVAAVRMTGSRFRRVPWTLLAIGTLGCVLNGGSRSALLLPLINVLLLSPKVLTRAGRRRTVQIASSMAIIGGILFAGLNLDPRRVIHNDPRTRVAIETLTGQRNLSELLGSDLSALQRRQATDITIQAFDEHPFMGVGLGRGFTEITKESGDDPRFYLDSPLLQLGKYGLIGCALLFSAYGLYVRAMMRMGSGRVHRATLLSALMALAIQFPFGPPMEERGFGLAMCFLVLALGSTASVNTKEPRGEFAQPQRRLHDSHCTA